MRKPKIRFKGFTEDWEQRKLGEIVERVSTTGTSGKELASVEYEDVVSEQGLLNKNIYQKETIKTGVRFSGEDVLYGKLRPYLHNWLNPDFPGIAVGDWWVLKPINIDKNFLYRLIQSPHFDDMANQSSGTKMPRADWKLMSSTGFCVPSNITEQAKIGAYFCNLDHLIILHQRKCDETKKLKKYMLQKMFPQNGMKVPEIRFEGFTSAWEQRKFCEFTFPAGERNKNDLKLKAYAITNEHGFIPQNEAHDDFGYMKNTDRTAYNIVRPHSFAYNPARINVGSIGYYEGQENVIVSSLYEVFQTEKYVDDEFLWQWFKADQFPRWIERLQEGSVRQYFYYDKLCECELMMPRVEEQRQIATYFSSLDHLITLHQRKRDELVKIKKYMLQNMFV